MIKRSLKIVVLLVLVHTVGSSQHAKFSNPGANNFGADIGIENAQEVGHAVSQMTEGDTLQVSLVGTIHEVCQSKGCWMTLEDEEGENSVFIKFKDYAFFVPLEAGGKKAIVQGKLYSSITSVKELQHYAEDEGLSKEEIAAITEPQEEIKMMADGIVIYN